jgi:hypothetical protein
MQIRSALTRIFKWTFVGALFLIAATVVLWIVLPDEKLLPEAKALIESRSTVSTNENAFFAMWGLSASPEADSHQAGQEVVAAFDHAYKLDGGDVKFSADAFLGSSPLGLKPPAEPWCTPTTPSCTDQYLASRAQIEDQVKYLGVHLLRYRALRAYPRYDDAITMSASTPLPKFRDVSALSALVDAGIAFRMDESELRKSALEDLHEEIVMWRRVGDETSSLVTKMTSAKLLMSKYRLLSETISRHPEIVFEHPDLAINLARPLSPSETSLKRVLAGEFRYVAATIADLPLALSRRREKRGDDLLFLRGLIDKLILSPFRLNATINNAFLRFEDVQRVSSTPSTEIEKAHASLQEAWREAQPLSAKDVFYNPVGSILGRVAAPDYSKYTLRMHDLAGFIRLIEIQRQLIRERIPKDAISQFIASRPANLRDPYSGAAMTWNEGTATIFFEGKGSQSNDKTVLSVRTSSRDTF